MEDLTSAEHKRFDEMMPALARYMGAHDGDSVTNVSADWINKLADCRQHAPVKLLLFEAWKAERSRQLMEAIEERSSAGDETHQPSVTQHRSF